jgi:nitrite reductase/ring-hydroxylating ferredoxin subunit
LRDLENTGAKGIAIGPSPDVREIVVVQTVHGVRAYANRCPHMYSTLETFPDRFLDESGEHLVCSTHGARFRVADGACVAGPCAADSLERVDVVIDGSDILLAE